MEKISEAKIKKLFFMTTFGFYLNECAQEWRFKSQFREFLSGFRCAEKELCSRCTPQRITNTSVSFALRLE